VKSFDIFSAVETFIVSTFDFSIHFSEYTVFQSPAIKLHKHGRGCGGVAVFVRNTLLKFVTQVHCAYDNMVSLKLSGDLLGLDRDVLYIAMYAPPYKSPYYKSTDTTCSIHSLEHFLLEQQENGDDSLILINGDLNARIGEWDWPSTEDGDPWDNGCAEGETRKSQDKVLNQFGKILTEFFATFHCLPLNGANRGDTEGKFTFVDSQGNSVIDYAIVSEELVSCCDMTFEVGSRVESSHMPIQLTVSSSNEAVSPDSHEPATETITKIQWDSDKTDTFTNAINSEESRANLEEASHLLDTGIDAALEKFNQTLLKASECMQKTININNSGNPSTNRWYDRECRDKKKSARQALRAFQTSTSDESKGEYNLKRKEYKETIRTKKNSYRKNVHQTLFNSKRDSKKFWNTVRTARQKRKRQPNIDINVWQDHFQKVLGGDTDNALRKANTTSTDGSVTDETDTNLEDNFNPFLDNPVTEDEVRDAIKNLKPGKASGLDDICGEFLKYASNMVVPFLTRLFNKLYNESYFPVSWGKSVIIPLHKKGDDKNPDNYRGITLLSIVSKIFTRILNSRLYSWAEDTDKISSEQAGFRRGFSTIDHIFTLTSIVKRKLYSKRGGKVYAAFIDYKKAFDSVNREKLWFMLQQLETSSKMIGILKAMYVSVESCVRWGATLSDFFGCPQGVKQGCLLSPLIFSLLISKVADEVRENGRHGFQLLPGGQEIFLLLFADDIVLLSSSPAGLQNQINSLERASKSLGLEVNLDKTKIMVFRKGGHLSQSEKWTFNGIKIEVVNSYKYLGFLLTTKLSADCACEEYVGKAKGKVLDLMKTMWSLGYFDASFFFQLFDAQVKPMLLYAAEIWGTAKLSIIETAHMFACKRLLGLSDKTPNQFIYGDTGRYSLYIDSCLASLRYWLKLTYMPDDRFPKQAYLMLRNSMDLNTFSNCKNWAWGIKNVLETYGFGNVWQDGAANTPGFLRLIRNKMIERFQEEWKDKVDRSDRFSIYRLFKQSHGIEHYLSDITIKRFRDCVIRFRFGINDLKANKRFYYSNSISLQDCPFCPNKREDEIHFIFHCPVYTDLRKKYVDNMIITNCDLDVNFQSIMKCASVTYSRNLGMYVFYAMKLREELLL